MEILQNFVAFSEYMNFIKPNWLWITLDLMLSTMPKCGQKPHYSRVERIFFRETDACIQQLLSCGHITHPSPSPPSTIISYCLHINSKSFFKDIFIVVKSKLYKLVYLCIQQLRTYHPPHPQLHIACILNWIYFQNFHICCVRIKFIFDSIYLGNLFNCITIFIDKYTLNDYKIKLLSKYIFSSY